MKLFDLVGTKVVISADALAIPPFNELWDSEKDKSKAEKYIKFIVLLYKFDSPYVTGYAPTERERVLKQDLFGDPTIEIPKKIYNLGQRYLEFQRTPSSRLLEAANEGIEYLIEEYHSLAEKRLLVDKLGKPIVTPEQVGKWLAQLGSAVKNRDLLLKQVQSEQVDTGKVRGGSAIGSFELPKSK